MYFPFQQLRTLTRCHNDIAVKENHFNFICTLGLDVESVQSELVCKLHVTLACKVYMMADVISVLLRVLCVCVWAPHWYVIV